MTIKLRQTASASAVPATSVSASNTLKTSDGVRRRYYSSRSPLGAVSENQGQALSRSQDLSRGLGQTTNATTIGDLLKINVEMNPDRTLLHWGTEAFSYKQCDVMADAMAHTLRIMFGLQKDDVLCLIGAATPTVLVLMLACAKAGILVAPLYLGYSKVEFKSSIENCRARVVICHPHFAPILRDMVTQDGLEVDAIHTFEETESLARNFEGLPFVPTPTRYWTLCYTSGSTGHPKGKEIPGNSIHVYRCACRSRYSHTALLILPRDRKHRLLISVDLSRRRVPFHVFYLGALAVVFLPLSLSIS